MPKYTSAELSCGHDEAYVAGYGIHFIESISWIKIWIIMALSTIAAFTFAGVWVHTHQGWSVRDVFSMGGTIVGIVAILLGLAHAVDDFLKDQVNA